MDSKLSAIAGILFAVFFVAGMIVISDSPDVSDSDQAIIDWYSDSGHQKAQLAGAYLLTLAGIAGAVFVSVGLGPRLSAAARDETSRTLAGMVGPAGILMATCITIGGFALAACSASAIFDDVTIDPGTARFLPSVGFGAILVGAGLAGAFVIAVSSVIGLRDRAFAPWLGWLGVVCAIALLGGVVFLPMVALPLWVLLASITFLSSSRRLAGAAAS